MRGAPVARLMRALRCLRLGLVSVGLFAGAALASAAESGFSATLSSDEKNSAGLDTLSEAEVQALDSLIAEDLAQARKLGAAKLPGTLSSRHSDLLIHAAGLDRLSPDQLSVLNAVLADAIALRPQPRERKRLGEDDVVLSRKRLEVHGGFSFTYGWAGGGRNFRETSAWTSFYDPETGLGLAVGLSNFSGDVLDPYNWYDYGHRYAAGYGYGQGADVQSVAVSLDRPWGGVALGFSRESAPINRFAVPLAGRGNHGLAGGRR
jgi:hypothetical protein